MYNEEVNKTALSSNDDKRLKTFDRIISYPFGANAGEVRKTELLEYLNMKRLTLMTIQIKRKQNIIQNGTIFQITHAKC